MEEKQLVDEFEKIEFLKKSLEQKEQELRKKLIEFSKQNNTDILFGTNKQCSIKEYEKIVYPEDKNKLEELIKSKGLYNILSSINYFKLSGKIHKGEIDKEILELIKKEKAYRIALKDKNKLVVG